MFTDEQIERYSHHIILREMGGKGHKKLLDVYHPELLPGCCPFRLIPEKVRVMVLNVSGRKSGKVVKS